MEFAVSIVLRAKRRLTINRMLDVAAFAATAGNPGGTRLEATMIVDATDLFDAAHQAIERVTALIAGTVISVHSMTGKENNRRISAVRAMEAAPAAP